MALLINENIIQFGQDSQKLGNHLLLYLIINLQTNLNFTINNLNKILKIHLGLIYTLPLRLLLLLSLLYL